MDYKKIGVSLTKLRLEKGWTQEDIANTLGISRQAVSKWESGVSLPDIELFLKLSELYGLSINDMLSPHDITCEEECTDDSDRDIENNKYAWNKQAQRYQAWANFQFDTFEYANAEYENENDLNILGDVSGKKVLEIGCGSANCGIILAKKGAELWGLDISEEQLSYADINAKKNDVPINLVQGSMDDLSAFKNKSFDMVISIQAINWINNLYKVCSEVSRVLKTNGVFVYTACHPVYDTVLDNQLSDSNSCRISYFDEWANKFKWRPEDDFEFVEYCRPIASYINAMAEAGLFIEKMHELRPIHDIKFKGNKSLELRVPTHMVFKARKVLV